MILLIIPIKKLKAKETLWPDRHIPGDVVKLGLSSESQAESGCILTGPAPGPPRDRSPVQCKPGRDEYQQHWLTCVQLFLTWDVWKVRRVQSMHWTWATGWTTFCSIKYQPTCDLRRRPTDIYQYLRNTTSAYIECECCPYIHNKCLCNEYLSMEASTNLGQVFVIEK